MNIKKVLGYGTLGCLTAPIWVPAALVGYACYKGARFAFKYPKITFGALGLSGMLWYASSSHGKQLRLTIQHTVVQAFENSQRHKAKNLEEKLNVAHEELEHANDALQQQRDYTKQLEQRLQAPKPPVQRPPVQQVSALSAENQLPSITNNDFNFYYVKRGDTLEHIAKHVSGDYNNHLILQTDNHIDDPTKLLTGQLLLVRKQFCTRDVPDVYMRVPRLRSIVLQGNTTISAFCNQNRECVNDTLEVNRHLGLQYDDNFPLRRGARVVYYR